MRAQLPEGTGRDAQLAQLRWVKTVFLGHLHLKTNSLPRQARDKHRESTQKTERFSSDFEISDECRTLLSKQRDEVGPHNVYNIYDNCPRNREFIEKTGQQPPHTQAH